MTQWYYTDAARNRLGPVSADALAALHAQGALGPATLVWRDGLADWRPWPDMAGEVLPATPASAADAAVDAPATGRAVFAIDAAPAGPGGDPYAIADPVAADPASPYAPPRAALADRGAAIHRDGHVVYAGFLKRFAGSTLDSFVTGILNYAVLIPLFMVMGLGIGAVGNAEAMAGAMGVGMIVLVYGISIGLPALYFAWMQSSSTQASLGKMAIGIKVVRTDGSPLGFGRSLLRYLAMVGTWVFTCGLGMVASAIMAGVTERKQALHDLICDTLVVDKHAFTDRPELQNEELGTVTIVVLVLYLLLVVGIVGAMVFAIGLGAAAGG